MRIIAFDIKLTNDWDEFVYSSKNGNILHTQNFLQYHQERFEDRSVMFFDNSNVLIGLFPANEANKGIISHGGSSYGGLIVGQNNTLDLAFKMFELLVNHFSKAEYIQFRNSVHIFKSYSSDEVTNAAEAVGFKKAYSEQSSYIEFGQNYVISKNRQEKISRSKKKLTFIADDKSTEEFYKLLSTNLDIKHQSVPTHNLKEIQDLIQRFPNKFTIYAAYYGDIMVAGIWLFELTPCNYHTFYLCQDYNFKKYYSLSGLIGFLMTGLKNKQAKCLSFGISTEKNGEELNEGLYSFKKSFGAEKIQRETYIYTNVKS